MSLIDFRLGLATVCLVTLAGIAHAQWGWTDAAGNKQFSDQPPPSSIPDGKIFKRPYQNDPLLKGGPVYGTNTVPARGSAQAAAAALAASAAANGVPPAAKGASAPAAGASKPRSADEKFKDRQEEKAKAEAEAQKKAEVEAKNKAECDRARGYLKSLDDGVRIAKNDEKGNRALLDDKQRAAEAKRTRDDIAARCK